MKYTGDWHIDEMELWQADYLNMEVENHAVRGWS